MAIGLIENIIPWVTITLWFLFMVPIFLNHGKNSELAKWLEQNRNDKWRETVGYLFGFVPTVKTGWNGIRYIFNDEDMEVERVRSLKTRLRKVFLFQSLILFLALIFVIWVVFFSVKSSFK